jgi:hypothetical protein
MKSDEDYFSRNMTYFNVFLRILRLGEKYAYFTVFYNGFERTEQLWSINTLNSTGDSKLL